MSDKVNRQRNLVIKNTLVLYVRMFITMGVSLYTSRLVLNALGVVDFGIYNVVGGVVGMFGFLNVAMASSTQRFLNYELGKGNISQLNKVFNASVTIHIIIAIFILLLAETIGLWFLNNRLEIPDDKINAANWVFQFSVLSSMISLIQVPLLATIIAYERMKVYAYISIVEAILKLLMALILTWVLWEKLKTYAILMCSVAFIILSIYSIYCNRRISICKFYLVKDMTIYKELTGFTGWNIFGGIVNILNTQGQNILLNIFGGSIVNAARGIAVQVTHALYSFISSFQTSVNPQIVKSYASKDFIYFQDLIFVSSKISFFLFLLLVVPVFTEMEQILYLWLNVVPEHTVVFCRYVLLTGLLTTFSSPIITAASSSGNIRKFQLIVNSVFLLNIPISYTFLKLGYNSDSVFQVALFMEAIALICRLLVVKTLVPFNVQKYFKHVLFKALVVFCIVMIPVYIIHSYFLPTIHRLFFTIIFSGLYCAIIIFFIGLSSKEKILLLNKIKRVIKR